jgi:GNAT superfamily N-acetyltransferase
MKYLASRQFIWEIQVKILGDDYQRPLDERLGHAGYERMDETAVKWVWLEGSRSRPRRSDEGRVAIEDGFGEAWIEAFCACNGHEGKRGIISRLLENVPAKKIVVSASVGPEIVGCGYGALERGWVGVFDIVVKKETRGQGLGEAIVGSILDRAATMGAARAYLQVVAGNRPAEGLYEKLGFREAYRYWYRARNPRQ